MNKPLSDSEKTAAGEKLANTPQMDHPWEADKADPQQVYNPVDLGLKAHDGTLYIMGAKHTGKGWYKDQDLPLNSITQAQTWVPVDGVKAYVADINHNPTLPEVMSYKGEHYVMSGHTRLSAQGAAGRTTVRVRNYFKEDVKNPRTGRTESVQVRPPKAEKLAKAAKARVPMTHRTEAVRKGEDELTARLRRALKKVGKQVAEAAAGASGLGKAAPDRVDAAAAYAAANAAIAGADWTLLINPTDEELRLVAQDGARQALLALGITDEGITEQVFQDAAEWAHERSAELVGMKYNAAGDLVENPNAEFAIDDDVRGAIRTAVSESIAAGDSAADLSGKIQDLAEFSADRAELIARTEIIRANNQGHLSAFRASGVVEKKEWSTAEDGDVCDECMGNEEQGPISLDSDFESGDDAAPAHPNCRCTIVAVVADQEEDDGE